MSDGRYVEIRHCNCENIKCCGEQACENQPTGEHRVMYVGHVCRDCWLNHDEKYRLEGS